MRVIASLIFLILAWFPQCFLYVLNETLSLLGSLYLFTIVSFKGGLPPPPVPPSFDNVRLVLSAPKILVPPPVK